ncbi:transcriptional regulator [Zafaria cholistanensis]|uniref:Transcriptional regulator n=1 Tax=Zafaria cholistanensis TaxID=1682741 RepID=A0A5A7NPD8_9MICC|nr:LCP family protein [Zafaria cholistanensis]GER21917.1 transcriptional regulator [Zafaria cholistanensis]
MGTYVPRRMARRRRRPLRIVLFSALGIVLVAGLVAGTYLTTLANLFNGKTQQIAQAFPAEQTRPVKDPADGSLNILLLGADSAKPAEESPQGQAAGATTQRADTMMLLHIPEDRSGLYVMSIMRDTWTDVPGYGEHKINSAMTLGGPPLVVQTLEALFGTKIDHVAMIDFEGFRDLTTALGGVRVKNDFPFTAHDTDYFYPVGKLTLEGDRALRFVRERKSFIDGDYQRVRNQQKFMKALMAKILTAETLSNPATVYQVIDKVSPYLSFDESFDAATAAGLGLQLKGLRTSDVELFTLPTSGVGTSSDGQSIVLRDEAAIAGIGAALRADTMDDWLEAQEELTASSSR